MDQNEIADYYARVVSPLLTAIRDAARILLPSFENKGLHLHETGSDSEGRVLLGALGFHVWRGPAHMAVPPFNVTRLPRPNDGRPNRLGRRIPAL